MAKTLADYTEAEFTDWVDEIIDYCRTDDTTGLDDALKNYEWIVGKPAAHDFVRFIYAVADYNRSFKSDNEDDDVPYTLPDAKDVVAGVKAWCFENKVPCFCADMPDSQVKLTRQELADMVSKMSMGGSIAQEDVNLYYRVTRPFGAPNFFDVPKGTPAEQIVDHICQWHAIYRKTTFS